MSRISSGREFMAMTELILAVSAILVLLTNSDAVKVVLLACVFYSIYLFGLTIASTEAKPIATVFWLYHAFFLLIPGWFQVSNNFYPWARVATDADMEYALVAIVLGLCSFSISYRLRGVRDGNVTTTIDESTVIKISALKIMLALAGTIPAVALIGVLGPATFLQERSELGAIIYQSDNLAILYNAAKFCVFGVAICLIAYLENRRNGKLVSRGERYTVIFFIFTALCVAVAILVNNPLSSPRFHFLGMMLGALLVLRPLRKRSTRFIAWATAPVFLYTLFPVVKNLGDAMSPHGDMLPDVGAYLTGGVDFDGLQQLANIARMTEGVGITWGSNFLSAMFFWMPRSLWDGKATGTGALAADFVGYEYSNLSAPLIGEALSGLGLLGVATFFTAMGWISAKYDARYEASLSQHVVGFDRLIVGTFAGFLFILLRGALNAVFPQIGVALLVVLTLAPRFKSVGSTTSKQRGRSVAT